MTQELSDRVVVKYSQMEFALNQKRILNKVEWLNDWLSGAVPGPFVDVHGPGIFSESPYPTVTALDPTTGEVIFLDFSSASVDDISFRDQVITARDGRLTAYEDNVLEGALYSVLAPGRTRPFPGQTVIGTVSSDGVFLSVAPEQTPSAKCIAGLLRALQY